MRQTRNPRRRPTAPGQSHFPFRLLNGLLKFVFLVSLGFTWWAWSQKDLLPSADFYYQELLTDPKQTVTGEAPFQVDSNGITYTIEPVANYRLNGVVVSYHDSDAFIDVYHRTDWKDFINIRDLCVIWGDNVTSQVYQEVEFSNTTWTCWVEWSDRATGDKFSMRHLSNNHLLAHEPKIHEAIMSARPGDQILIDGLLANYSHSRGEFQRGTSTVRTDTGNGACETIYVRDFRIVKPANQQWRQVYAVAKWIAILSFVGLAVIFVTGPVRRPKF